MIEILLKKTPLPFLPRFPPSTSVTTKGCTTTPLSFNRAQLARGRYICNTCVAAKDVFAALIHSSETFARRAEMSIYNSKP